MEAVLWTRWAVVLGIATGADVAMVEGVEAEVGEVGAEGAEEEEEGELEEAEEEVGRGPSVMALLTLVFA